MALDDFDTPQKHELDALENQPPAGEATLPPAPVQTPAPKPVPSVPKTFDPKAPIHGLTDKSDLSLEGVALATKAKLAKEPKVRMMIPLDPGEKPGAYRTVSLNGYVFLVKKNVMVDLPLSVANLLARAYEITTDILENDPLNLNRADSEKKRALGVI